MQVERWASSGKGRSRTVAYGNLIWTVANASDPAADFETQVAQSLAMLESHLEQAGSARTHLLSLQVILADIGNRNAFDSAWQRWIGVNPEHWPQRACFQSGLAPGLQVELVAVAAPATALQVSSGRTAPA
jgi:enamine deaminase RidA (YjgF/YER057c/UK114 family)